MAQLVYFLVNPISDQPFYIGIGSRRRLRDHFIEANTKKNSHKLSTIRKLRSLGVLDAAMVMVIATQLTQEEAWHTEEFLIGEWGRRSLSNGPLTNMIAGGQPIPMLDPLVKAKNMETRNANPNYIQNIRNIRIAEWSDSTKRAARCRAMKEAKKNPETRAKHVAIGKESYPHNRLKMFASFMAPHKATARIDRAKIASDAAKEKLADPQHAAALADKRKAIWADPEYKRMMGDIRRISWAWKKAMPSLFPSGAG